MLNYIWAGMIILGVCVAAYSGNLEGITQAAITSSKDAVNLCITLVGFIAMWMGLMRIGEKAGLIEGLSKKMRPILRFLFPDVPDHHPAQKYIATNMIANFLGLGWAATPPGLEAMKSLQELNPKKDTASRAMCTFLIVNISSVQILPITILAYRSQYGSVSPSEIIGPAIVATIVSTATGILFAKVMGRVSHQ